MQHEFLGMVAEAREAGATVFLSSHVLSEVQRAADRVAVLRAGRIVTQGTVDELRGRARQRIEVWFADEADPTELRSIPGLEDAVIDGKRLAGTLSGPVDPVLAVLARHRVASLVVEEPNLEDAFLDSTETVHECDGRRTRTRTPPADAAIPARLGDRARVTRGGDRRLLAGVPRILRHQRGDRQLPSGIVDAFGLAGFGTPAGFLRGNLYEFIVPLLLAVAAVAAANGLTAGEEDSGRMETFLSQPVTRQSVFLGRTVALVAWLVVMTGFILLVQLASDAVVGLEIDTMRVVSTVVLCGFLALLFGTLALAVAGWLPRPSLVLAIGIAAAVGGYLIAALFPLSDPLKSVSNLSPWKWALGGDPLVNGAEPWRYVALIVPFLALVALAVAGFIRRDVRAA